MNYACVARIAAALPALLALIVGLGSSLLTPNVVYGASGKIFAVVSRVPGRPRVPVVLALLAISVLAGAFGATRVSTAASVGTSGARIDSVGPAAAARGALVELRGGGFGAKTVHVWVGGVSAQVLTATGNRVLFSVPATAPLGATSVEAANPGDSKASAPFTVLFDGNATPLLSAAPPATATIGRDGGTLESNDIRLDIPAGALSEDVAITLRLMAGLDGSPLDGTFIGGAKLEPEGLRFLKPATLSLPLPGGVSAVDVLGFGSAGDGSDLHLLPREVQSGRITIELWHFSTGGASSGGAAAARAMQTYQPTTAEGQALQRIATATPDCEAERTTGNFTGPACTRLEQEIIRALFDWYVNAVRPALQNAVGAPSFEVDATLQEWLSWAATVAAKLNGGLQSELTQALDLASDAVADLARRRLNNCTGTALPSQFRDVARVADYAEAGSVDLAAEGLPADLLHACAHLEIEITDFPQIAALLFANTLRGRVVVHPYNGPDRNDVPFTLTLDGLPVGTAGNGSFQATITPTTSPVNSTLEAAATNIELQTESFGDRRVVARPARPRVELIALASVNALHPGDTVPLRAKVAGDGMSNATISYTMAGIGQLSSSSGTTDAAGEGPVFNYNVPANSPSGTGTVTVTFQGSTDSLTVTVTSVAVTISPTGASLAPGHTRQFAATVTGTANTAVTWTGTGGAITQSGLYTAGTTTGIFSVTATSVADPTASETIAVEITDQSAFLGFWTGTFTRRFSDGQGGFIQTQPDALLGTIRIALGGSAGQLILMAEQSRMSAFSLCNTSFVAWLLVLDPGGSSFTATERACGPLIFAPDVFGRTLAGRLEGDGIAIDNFCISLLEDCALDPSFLVSIRLTRLP